MLGHRFPAIGWPALIAAMAVAVVLVGLVVARQGSRRRKQVRRLATAGDARDVDDLFQLADRLAAEADFPGAVRQLALAVAIRLVAPDWFDLESNPLTIREIYRSSGDGDRLAPLLSAFEESFYGHHPITAERYRKAAAAAEPHRMARARAA